MNLPRSSFYYRPKGKTPSQQEHEKAIEERIEALCLEFPRYGYRRITAQLHREGLLINRKKVLKIMKSHDLLCRPHRKWVKTTQSDHGYPLYPNLLKIDRLRPSMRLGLPILPISVSHRALSIWRCCWICFPERLSAMRCLGVFMPP